MPKEELDCARALTTLLSGAEKLSFYPTPEQQQQLIRYCQVLREATAKLNLTGIRSAEGIMRILFLDSLTLSMALPPELTDPRVPAAPRVVDLGAGAGVPGLPLRIVYPHWSLTLVESIGKKARFLEMVVRRLALSGVTVLAERAEESARKDAWRDRADLCMARAVGPLPTLVELCAPMVRSGGWLALPKSGQLDKEVGAARPAMRALKVELERIAHVPEDLGLGATRAIVMCRKIGPTPPVFPRRVGLARTRPIQA